MCTVTVIKVDAPIDGSKPGIRIACNRDERPSRPPANGPSVHQAGDRNAIYPVDPEGGGTWIGANDAGVAMSLLNVNINSNSKKARPGSGIPAPVSRGRIIPLLLNRKLASQAADGVAQLSLSEYQPFRLIVVDPTSCIEAVWNGGCFSLERYALDRPRMFTSSGLGDDLVDPPRRELFSQTLARESSPAAQDRFHRHRWPDALHLSVCMSRSDARTVSFTTVDIAGELVAMNYSPDSPEVATQATRIQLLRK